MKIEIKVQPQSGREEIIQLSKDKYKVFLKKAPEGNKANTELFKLLKKHFKLTPKILKGKTSKNKIIELE